MPSVRSRLVLILTLFVLAACSDSTSDNPNTPDTPGEPDLTALVVGEADSPFLDVLTERTRMVQDNGSQKVTDYDLVIFDGDTHTPAALTEHTRMAEVLQQGAWVLVADASEAHKQEGTEPLLGFASQNDTDAHLFRSVPGDMPVFDIVELSPMTQSLQDDEPLGEALMAQLQERHYQRFVERVVAKVGSGTTPQQSGGCASPLNIEAGIIYATWCYSPSGDYDLDSVFLLERRKIAAGDVIRGHTVLPQSGENDVSYTFTLLLNNADAVTGNSQSLHVAANGQMTPTTTTWPSGIEGDLTGKPYLMGQWFGLKELYSGVGFVQSKLDLEMGPASGSQAILRPAARYEPQTPNNVETDSYTSGTSFTIGATLNAGVVPKGPSGGGSVSGSYTVSSSSTQTRTITDWTWTADATGAGGSSYNWMFSSRNPRAGSNTLGSKWDEGWSLAFGASLNELNQRLMGYGAEAVWTTPNVSTEKVTFSVSSVQHLVNLQDRDFLGPRLAQELLRGPSQSVSLDLSAVIPVTLEPASLTFTDAEGNAVTQANPVSAGQNVTATVNLSGAAPFSYSITSLATSTFDNAVITESPVRITKGDSSKTFTIETNANSLASGDTVAVDIFLGSFGSQAAEQLWIINN